MVAATFAGEVLTPVVETEFLVRWRPIEQLSQYKTRKNIFLLARLDSNLPVSEQVKANLNETVVEGIRSGDYFHIPQQNAWARGQYVLFLVAPTRDAMLQRLYDLGELAYDDFADSYYRRLRERMFKRYEQTDVQEYIELYYPFTIRVQHDYRVVDESTDERYVWLRRTNNRNDIDRSILVHWIPNDDSIRIGFDWIVAQRNRLADSLFAGDEIVEEETTLQQTRFGSFNALRLEGTWMNPELVVGGPFRTIVFIDRESDLIYLVDMYVQAVGKRKKPFLDQLEVLVHTLKPRSRMQAAGE